MSLGSCLVGWATGRPVSRQSLLPNAADQCPCGADASAAVPTRRQPAASTPSDPAPTWVLTGSTGLRENSQRPTLLVWKRRTRPRPEPVAHTPLERRVGRPPVTMAQSGAQGGVGQGGAVSWAYGRCSSSLGGLQ